MGEPDFHHQGDCALQRLAPSHDLLAARHFGGLLLVLFKRSGVEATLNANKDPVALPFRKPNLPDRGLDFL